MKIYYKILTLLLVFFSTPNVYAYTYDQLVSMLNSPNAYTRGTAAEALGDSGNQRAGSLLVRTLRTDNAPYVEERCAEALGKLNYKKAIPFLIQALFENERYLTRYAALSLGQLRAKDAVAPLELVLNNKIGNNNRNLDNHDGDAWETNDKSRSKLNFSVEDRSNAADALGMIGNLNATNTLINNLHDPDWRIRLRCVLALGSLKNPKSYKAVNAMLNDVNPRVHAAARIALALIPPPSAQHTNNSNPTTSFNLSRSAYSKYQAIITKSVLKLNR